jgi:hypothetical protein
MELPHTSIDPSVAADICTFPHSAKPMIADSVIDRMELASGSVNAFPFPGIPRKTEPLCAGKSE